MGDRGTFWLPPQVSTISPEIDGLFYFILGWSLIFFIGVVATMTYFVWKFRRRHDRGKPPVIKESQAMEVAWIIGPTILVLVVFVWAFRSFINISVAPPGSYQIYVTGKQWLWEFHYPTGLTTVNELTVPVDRPVQLILTSEDVIHSFFVPAFRVKHDAVPNRYTSVWFEATRTGTYIAFCAEYCGRGHADMPAEVNVVTQAEFDEWVVTGGIDPELLENLEEFGATLYERRGCVACHTTDGRVTIGPSLLGLYGTEQQYTDGTTEILDEEALHRAILRPQEKTVVGFEPVMPAIPLQDVEVRALIEFIKSLD